MRWAVNVVCVGQRRSAYRLLVGKHKGNIPLAIPRDRWDNNIKMDLQVVVLGHGLD
jgi:hypothetical protein